MPVYGDFGLEKLLGRSIDVGSVCERKVFAKLLFHGDPSRRVAEHPEVVGINLYRACAEEFLDSAAHGGVKGPAKQSIGCGIRSDLFLLCHVETLLVLRASQSEQGDNVASGKGGSLR